LGIEPEGEVQQFCRKQDDGTDNGWLNRRSTAPPARR
jgi:hypothetical protein